MKKIVGIVGLIVALIILSVSSTMLACSNANKTKTVYVDREVPVEVEVEKIVEVEKTVEVPVEVEKVVEVEKTVEVEVPVEVEVEKIVEVEKVVEVPVEVEKVVEVEKEVNKPRDIKYIDSYDEACELQIGDELENLAVIITTDGKVYFLNSQDTNCGVGLWSGLEESKKYQPINGGNNNHIVINPNYVDGCIYNGYNTEKLMSNGTPTVNLTYYIAFVNAKVTDVKYSTNGTATLKHGYPVTITIDISRIDSSVYVAMNG